MKWIALAKINDMKMMGEYHSGSSKSYQSEANFDTKEEADAFIRKVTEQYDGENGYNQHRDRNDKYKLTPCVFMMNRRAKMLNPSLNICKQRSKPQRGI